MATGQYLGVSGVARKVKNKYLGVSGVARKVKSRYIGVSGVARLFWKSTNDMLMSYLRDDGVTDLSLSSTQDGTSSTAICHFSHSNSGSRTDRVYIKSSIIPSAGTHTISGSYYVNVSASSYLLDVVFDPWGSSPVLFYENGVRRDFSFTIEYDGNREFIVGFGLYGSNSSAYGTFNIYDLKFDGELVEYNF